MIFGNRIFFSISILVLVCAVFSGCATAKKFVPWGKSNSDADALMRVDGSGEDRETSSNPEPSARDSMKRVDLSVPSIERDQVAIVDPTKFRSSSVARSGADAIATSASPAEGAASDADTGADDWGRGVQQAIHSRWVQPRGPNIPTDFSCDVMVKLTPFGGVDDVKIVRSCGDVALDASIETAIRESSPLPTPKDPANFSDTLMLTFTPR